MGMCKGCGQIFKTEDMIHNFCTECQKTEKFTQQEESIKSGQEKSNQLKDKKFFYLVIFLILTPFAGFHLLKGNFDIVFFVMIFPIIGLLSLIGDIYYNSKHINEYKNKGSKIDTAIKNKKEILVKSLIVISTIWILLVMPKSSYNMKIFILEGIIPVVLVFGIVWIYFAYSKNKKNLIKED